MVLQKRPSPTPSENALCQLLKDTLRRRAMPFSQDCNENRRRVCEKARKKAGKDCDMLYAGGGTLEHLQQRIAQELNRHSTIAFKTRGMDTKYRRFDIFYYDYYMMNTPPQFHTQQQHASKGLSGQERRSMKLDKEFRRMFPDFRPQRKDSGSNAIVYRGRFEGRDVFVKSYPCAKTKLLQDDYDNTFGYEKEIYRLIRSRATTENDIREAFINMVVCIKDVTNGRGYVFTEDVHGTTVQQQLSDYANKEKMLMKIAPASVRLVRKRIMDFIKKIFFQMLYILHLMHDKLRIVHNDMHTGNLILVSDNKPNKTIEVSSNGAVRRYKLRDHPYHLKVYDFDLSSMMEHPNPFLTSRCNHYGHCNDVKVDLFSWFYLIYGMEGTDLDIYRFCKHVTTAFPKLKGILDTHDPTDESWFRFCLNNTNVKGCVLPSLEGFTLEFLMTNYYRFVLNPDLKR